MTERNFNEKALKQKYEAARGRAITPPSAPDSAQDNAHKLHARPDSAQDNAHELRANVSSQETSNIKIPDNLSEQMGITSQKKLYDIPTMSVDLPSGGRIYEGLIPDGVIKIKALEQKEIDILNTDHLNKKNIAFDTAIDSCILEPKVSSNVLISADRVYLLFKLFELSKGTSVYDFTEKCPKCGQKNKISIDISGLEVRRINLASNKFSVLLPLCKKNITYHLLTGNERKEIENKIKILMSQTAASKLIDTTTTETLIKSIDEVEGVPPTQKVEFIKHLIYGDSVRLREHMNDNTPGINPVYEFSCVNCEFEDKLIIPITSSFFSMASNI
jgi:hypothetical protein